MYSFIILFVLIIVMVYFAIMYENVAIMLVAYVQIVLLIAGLVNAWFRKKTLKGKIEIPVGVSEIGKENMVKVTVTNLSAIPVIRMKALLGVEDTLGGGAKDEWVKLSAVSRGESSFMRSVILPGAGNYEITLEKLRVFDWTGLLYIDLPMNSSGRIQVLPELHCMPVRLTMAVKNFYGESDVYDEHTPGHDKSQMLRVRSYQAGDRLQSVHWKLTAKQDELMVKEGSLPKSCPVVVFMDPHPQARSKRIQNAVPFIEVVASISFSLMDAGCPHYVVWYDDEVKDVNRLRVEDEESLFYFISVLMGIRWEQSDEDLVERYRELHRQEPFVWAISVDEKLVLKKGNSVLAQLPDGDLKQALSQVELLL